MNNIYLEKVAEILEKEANEKVFANAVQHLMNHPVIGKIPGKLRTAAGNVAKHAIQSKDLTLFKGSSGHKLFSAVSEHLTKNKGLSPMEASHSISRWADFK